MEELNYLLAKVHLSSITGALQAAFPGQIIGLSNYGEANRPISVWVNSIEAIDLTALQAVVNAHDPVFLSADKTAVKANGVDAVTVTVQAANPVTLSVTTKSGTVDWIIPLVNGIGSDTLTALDPDIITISVKNPVNRSTDTLIITAS